VDLLIPLAKVGGLIWTTIFGLLGLLTRFRDETTGRVTKWGRIALLGILTSGFVSLLGYGAEYVAGKEKERQELRRLTEEVARQERTLEHVRQVLSEVERQHYSIEDMRVTVSFRIPEDHPLLVAYAAKIRETYDGLIDEYQRRGHAYDPKHPNIDIEGRKEGGKNHVERIWIDATNLLFPQQLPLSLGVGLYPEGTDGSSVVLNDHPLPELQFGLYAGRMDTGRLYYFPSEAEFVLWFTEKPGRQRSSPSVISLRDFPNKLLAVGILSYDNKEDRIILDRLEFSAKSGVSLIVGGGTLKKTAHFWPEPSYYGTINHKW
jgi:hypothetical protein